MKTILYAENANIKFDENEVLVNDKNMDIEEPSKEKNQGLAIDKMREFYTKVLSKQYDNIIVLSGAGTSVNIGKSQKGLTMGGLWDKVTEKIGEKRLNEFVSTIKYKRGLDDKNLENLMSQALLFQHFENNLDVNKTIKEIEAIIRQCCTLDLPPDSPHSIFLKKITARKLKYPRVKIFTLNYDLLFEQAASSGGYIVIDGFSFNTPRKFNGIYYDYDIVSRNISNKNISDENFIPRVFNLYKPHGSLDWESEEDEEGNKIFVKKDQPTNPVLIYPSTEKYELSYEQPYFEMLSRLQQELRCRNTLLLVIGFSFGDKHIKAMVSETLKNNPSITLIIVSPDVAETHEKEKDEQKIEKVPHFAFEDFKIKSQIMKNVILISETFADFAKHYPYSEIYSFNQGEEQNESI